ncbi:uncharacterized protein LOC135827972 [Sycon ciliatum]|uniref:uncharacterized protein LOC135827972 n=1 Tax=Sycon ciliatum TaxID=27933 RepID=UPI0031F6D0D5
MANEVRVLDGAEELEDFLKVALPRASFVTRTTEKPFSNSVEEIFKEAILRPKAFIWSQERGTSCAPIPFDGAPFVCCGFRILECQFGKHRCHTTKSTESSDDVTSSASDHSYPKASADKKKKRIKLQGTRKIGCEASCNIRRILRLPAYSVDSTGLSASALVKAKAGKVKELKISILAALDAGDVSKLNVCDRFVVSYPTEGSHSGHDVITEKGKLASELSHNSEFGRAYHPELKDIRSHIALATHKLQQSRLDQTQMAHKVKAWSESPRPPALLQFRPYVPDSEPSECSAAPALSLEAESDLEASDGRYKGSGGGDDEPLVDPVPASSRLLVIHQEVWQRELLVKYGELVLMDATYRTTCYDLALFFLVVHTNTGYIVVAEFCVQSKKHADIAEALTIIKQRTPSWKPKFFMTDYSQAEMLALEEVLKYAFLKSNNGKKRTLRDTFTIIIEQFLPEQRDKYLKKNIMRLSSFRRYNDYVPVYLRDRPRNVILHCMEREQSSQEYMPENGEAAGDHQYNVKSFGRTRLVCFETPSCSCEDWNLRALPCKHMFAVFKNVPGCSWESLPETYRSSPKMTLDIDLGDGEVHSEDLEVPEQVNNSHEVGAQLSDPVSNEIPLHRTQQQQNQLSARQARNMLKVIDAQTFVCTDSSALKNLCAQLEKLSEELAKTLPTDESGLVIQEASSFTLNQHFSARRRLHETHSTAVPDPALESGHAKRGRPAVERHLRCRVGVSGETERRQFLQAQQSEKGVW